eukprot:TRINITY_DN2440_c0_g3_i1.p1 TRINITY_DN2440_c0_g3~~TRINITY_DN2440_c0_g3_i1.p1  ORF type:complete len:358 (+),score=53.29 TRINITY_DN2440_c0_g3_i1:120-1193(+)
MRVWSVHRRMNNAVSDWAFGVHARYRGQPLPGDRPVENNAQAGEQPAAGADRQDEELAAIDELIAQPRVFLPYIIFEVRLGLFTNLSLFSIFLFYLMPNLRALLHNDFFNTLWLCAVSALNTLSIIPRVLSLIKLHRCKRLLDNQLELSRALWTFARSNIYTINRRLSQLVLYTYFLGTYKLLNLFFSSQSHPPSILLNAGIDHQRLQSLASEESDTTRTEGKGRLGPVGRITKTILNDDFLSQFLVLMYAAKTIVSYLKFCCAFSPRGGEVRGNSGGLRCEELQTLPTFHFTSESSSQARYDTCAICLRAFAAGDELRGVRCKGDHVYHRECIDGWLQSARSCPLCKSEVLSGPPT